MGIKFYLFDKATRRAFILGKGCWDGMRGTTHALPPFPTSRDAHATPEATRDIVLAYWQLVYREGTHAHDVAFSRRLAVILWPFMRTCGAALLRNDSCEYGDEHCDPETLEPTNYTVVGSRYGDDEDVRPDPLEAAVAPLREQARRSLMVADVS